MLDKRKVNFKGLGHFIVLQVGVFDMPNPNRYDILSISIFCKIPLSISIFSRMAISISISISIFFKFADISTIDINIRYFIDIDIFQNLLIDIDINIDIFKSDLIDIDIDIDIFKKCRYIDNRYGLSIYRTPLLRPHFYESQLFHTKYLEIVLCPVSLLIYTCGLVKHSPLKKIYNRISFNSSRLQEGCE